MSKKTWQKCSFALCDFVVYSRIVRLSLDQSIYPSVLGKLPDRQSDYSIECCEMRSSQVLVRT